MRKLFAELLYNEMSINKDIYLITGDLGYGLWDKIKETYFESNHTLKSITTYDYDKKGLIKEKCIYNDLGKLIYRKVNNYE